MPAVDETIEQHGRPKRIAKRADQRTRRDNRIEQKRKPTTTVKRALGYARFSVGRDGKISDEFQVDEIEQRCRQRGWELGKMLVERGKSAGEGKSRPWWEFAADEIASGKWDVFIVWKLDRAIRSVGDFDDMWKLCAEHGVEFVCCVEDVDTSTKFGKGMLYFSAVFAEIERDTIVLRNTEIADYRREQMLVPGGRVPYGYRKTHRTRLSESSGRMVDEFKIEPSEAAVIRDVVGWIMGPERLSLRACVRRLNETGVPTSATTKVGEWRLSTLRQILTAPAIAALRDVPGEGEFCDAGWEAIIDHPTWSAMLDELKAPERQTYRGEWNGNGAKHLLSGLVRCGRCGTKLRPQSSPVGQRYRCAQPEPRGYCCGGPSILAEDIEAEVIKRLFDECAGRVVRPAPIETADNGDAELLRLQLDLDEVDAMHRNGEFDSVGEWQANRRPVKIKLDALRAKLDRASKADERPSKIVALLNQGGSLEAMWDALTIPDRRAVIRDVLPTITLLDNGKRGVRLPASERVSFDPADVNIDPRNL